MPTMQTITPDFLMSQLRLALVAVLAYGGGAHWFTPEAAGLYLTLFTTLGPIAIPWAWSIASNLGKVFVRQGSAAAQVAAVEKKDPASASAGAATAVAATVKILLIAFLPLILLAGGSAHAQTGNIAKDIAAMRAKTLAPKAAVVAVAAPAAPAASGLQKFMNDLAALQKKVVDDTVADLAAADADAATLTNASDPTSFRDPIAHACYPAATKFLQSLPAASPTTGTLVAVQLFQKQRDFVAQIQAGLPVYLKLGCAPLLGDEATTFTKIMGLVGVTVAANSLLPGISAIMPVLP